MARFYANENFPVQAVRELRRLGHDVLTSLESGNANRSVPDEAVLGFAAERVICDIHRVGATGAAFSSTDGKRQV